MGDPIEYVGDNDERRGEYAEMYTYLLGKAPLIPIPDERCGLRSRKAAFGDC